MTDISFDMVYGSVEKFPLEIPIMNRDRTTGLYSPSIFYFCQVICSLIIGLVVTVVRWSVLFWMVDFKVRKDPDHSQAETFFLLLLLYESTMQVAVAYGYMICCIGGSMSLSLALANPCMLIPMLFAGFFIAKPSIPAPISWISYLSFMFYGFEAISIVLWRETQDVPTHCNSNETIPYTEVLRQWGYDESHLSLNIGMLFVLLTIFHMVALISLNVRHRRK